MHLSLNALNGAFKPTVMRLVGTHGRKSIHILVDSDSAHNFLSEKTTYRLGCALKSVEVAKVLVANDQKLLWNMVCEGFEQRAQGQLYKVNAYIPPLDNYDLISGVKWLATLGNIMWNFQELKMVFKQKDKVKVLQGSKGGGVSVIDQPKLLKLLKRDCQIASVQMIIKVEEEELNMLQVAKIKNAGEQELKVLLLQFQDVFGEQNDLPPMREHVHQIILEEGSQPINIRS